LHNFTRQAVDFRNRGDHHFSLERRNFVMRKVLGALLLCAASAYAGAAPAETFVIQSDKTGHEATVKIPVGAVTKLSANFAESLAVTDPEFESMRLRGDVLISIAGSVRPIQIKADNIVLELTPDSTQYHPVSSRADSAANKLTRATTLSGGDDSQVLVGNVVFDLQTAAGPMEIKADRVEHQLSSEEPVSEAGT
jgi:hypothetical protein